VAKLIYNDGSGLGSTIEDVGLAIKHSMQYSTPEVLDMWLNAAYYGNGHRGASAAAEGLLRLISQILGLGGSCDARRTVTGSFRLRPAPPLCARSRALAARRLATCRDA
jgi:hypothetical protein